MYITPMTPYVNPLEMPQREFKIVTDEGEVDVKQPTFLDVFSNIFNEAIVTNEQKSEDMIKIMLGDVDNIEEIQLNLKKAELATELFINVKNSVVDAYNEVIRMSI
ncbi:MAG: flagellar hook-basal body complex protein FliE [Oscillospiraceae bacterium]|nr:flagellar hook-basal body complex protein FliE [Oscillospiraceae bacterium]